jgi:N-methylhydantoinase A
MAASIASERLILIVESGPAAGVIAAQHLARDCNLSDVIAVDMGGTTAKASIIESGRLQRASEFEVAGGLNIGNRLNPGRSRSGQTAAASGPTVWRAANPVVLRVMR